MQDDRLESVAHFVGCSVEDVTRAFGNIPDFTIWNATRVRSGSARLETAKIEEAASLLIRARNLLIELPAACKVDMSGNDLELEAKISEVIDRLQVQAAISETPLTNFSPEGRKNLAAHWVAERIAVLFRITKRNIGFGLDGGFPSTPFGKAVDHAFAVFGIDADWRQPAKAAAQKARQCQ